MSYLKQLYYYWQGRLENKLSIMMLWFNPSRLLSTSKLLAHFLCSGLEERTGKEKVRKLMDWNKYSLLDKAKAVWTKQNKEFIHYFSLESKCSNTSRKAELIVCNSFLARQMPCLQTSMCYHYYFHPKSQSIIPAFMKKNKHYPSQNHDSFYTKIHTHVHMYLNIDIYNM